jgi:hypothetical protein
VADFSNSGVADLPFTTADSLQHGDPKVLGWLREMRDEGDRINRSDPSYDQIEPAMRYIVGEQLRPERSKLKYLPQVVINESRHALQAHVSALTDIKPVFGWRTINTAFQRQADILNQYAIAEWVTQFFDMELGEVIKYSLAAGTGDLVVDWDPHVPFGGANSLSARDCRDTLPFRPSHARSPQLWEGVTLREGHTVNALKAMYPGKQHLFTPSSDSVLDKVKGSFRRVVSALLTPADPLDRLGQEGIHTRQVRSGEVALYRTYLKDRTRNLTAKPIGMGMPGANYAYSVAPQGLLYPRGRLIVSTDNVVLYDGPNQYWHGLFPICRLRLWGVPWQFLGIPLFNDLLPVQDAINDTVNDVRLGIRQWLNPDVVYNRNAVSEATMKLTDPQRPGKRLKVQPGFGDPYTKLDGPNPQVLAQASELWDKLTTKHNDLSGVANLTALLQLRQLPSADTIQKYYDALTPEIRMEARQAEMFMRDLSEMIKVNYFQFLSHTKRRMILGDQAVVMEDTDNDPATLVPAVKPGEPGYTPELDPNLTTADQRAQFFHKQFIFVAAPNSILALHSTERRMIAQQQATMGYIDFWSYHEVFETPNVGAPPAIPLPPLKPVTPEDQLFILTQIAGQIQQQAAAMGGQPPPQPGQEPGAETGGGAPMGGAMPGPGPIQMPDGRILLLDPMSGQILELRVPTTITERLQAQQMLGLGMMANAQGRKASNEEPPQQETKNDRPGGRSTTSTSKK